MPNNKNNTQSGSKGSMGNNPDREFESQGKDKDFGTSGHGKETGGSRQGSRMKDNMEDDEITTAGGREGQFSDTEGGSKQWSPGSKQSSDQ